MDRNSGGQARKGSGGVSPSRSTASCQRSLTATTGSSTAVRSSCSTTNVSSTRATCRCAGYLLHPFMESLLLVDIIKG